MKYEELRETYPKFFYHGFDVEEKEENISIVYDFEIEGLSSFNPTWTIPLPENAKGITETKLFKDCAFNLGMIELISYWKISCPPETIVECGTLDETQKTWWKKLYFHGLGEFFYTNGIETSLDDFMNLRSVGKEQEGTEYPFLHQNKGCLVPVGGGKDSFVSLHVLEGMKEECRAFVINAVPSAIHASIAAGYEGENLINPKRTLDKRMLELNKQGYLNGHTPFSAMAAFASYLCAVVTGRKYICLSNEASANESTVKDSDVNHQYSKTFDFEKDFYDYSHTYLNPDILYFSLLRPLSELQIAAVFSTLKKYHPVFRSCNVGQKEEKWCGHCAKCLFVCIMLSAYLSDEELIAIFGRDMLNDPEMMELFEQLTGILDNKPFECVGTRDEVNTAVCMSIRNHEKNGKELPLLYQNYKDSAEYYSFYRDKSVDLNAWNSENLLPEEFETLLRRKMGELHVNE